MRFASCTLSWPLFSNRLHARLRPTSCASASDERHKVSPGTWKAGFLSELTYLISPGLLDSFPSFSRYNYVSTGLLRPRSMTNYPRDMIFPLPHSKLCIFYHSTMHPDDLLCVHGPEFLAAAGGTAPLRKFLFFPFPPPLRDDTLLCSVDGSSWHPLFRRMLTKFVGLRPEGTMLGLYLSIL